MVEYQHCVLLAISTVYWSYYLKCEYHQMWLRVVCKVWARGNGDLWQQWLARKPADDAMFQSTFWNFKNVQRMGKGGKKGELTDTCNGCMLRGQNDWRNKRKQEAQSGTKDDEAIWAIDPEVAPILLEEFWEKLRNLGEQGQQVAETIPEVFFDKRENIWFCCKNWTRAKKTGLSTF